MPLFFTAYMKRSSQEVLQQYWGYTEFRPLQEEIIASVLDGKDTLALLPTGGGKSICFQVPGLCMEGICLVISPLIALMKDQVNNLLKRGIPAAAVHAGMHKREIDIILENACNGAYKFLYLSPERIRTELAIERIKRMKLSLLAVDEAHCISQWGYDFRPAYLQISELRALIPDVPVLALTATATSEVVNDIQEKLEFKAPLSFRQSFYRSNLSYSVLYEPKKLEKLVDILRNVPGSGIVYVRSRGETKEIARILREHRINAAFYHAGLPQEERNLVQEAWMTGKSRIIVSTNAFGMGIDKPDVRIVVHLNLPDGLENYFQEAGRAGRDGQKSYAVLLYVPTDADTLRFHVKAAFPPPELIRRVYQALGSYTQLAIGAGFGESFDFDLPHFCNSYSLEHAQTHSALRLLEQEGWIALSDGTLTPARARLIANRETMYDYQLRDPLADKIIKVMLRAYPGIQQQLVDISETNISQYAKLAPDLVIKTLERAHQAEVLEYFPLKNKPQLSFLRERVDAQNLQLDLEKLNFRKQRAEERVEQSIKYAESRRCRSQLLLQYFNEKSSNPCGICDVCTGRNSSDLPLELYQMYEKKIREALRHEPLPLDELLKAFALKKQNTVAEVISYLLDEQKLLLSEDGLVRFKD